jgi:hypothetical protein
MEHTRPPAGSYENPQIPLYSSSGTSPTARLAPRNHHHPSNRWIAGNFLHASSSWDHDAAPVASHRYQLKCPSTLQSIIVVNSPETPFSSAVTTIEDGPHHRSGTIWITHWTPVDRITDLVDWLVQALLVEEGSAMAPPMPLTLLRNDEKKEDDASFALQYARRPYLSSSELAFYSDDDAEEHHHSYHHHPYHNVQEDWISDGEETTKTSSRRPQVYDELAASFLPPNRFHIGYSRSSSRESLGGHDPCEEAMDISLHSD